MRVSRGRRGERREGRRRSLSPTNEFILILIIRSGCVITEEVAAAAAAAAGVAPPPARRVDDAEARPRFDHSLSRSLSFCFISLSQLSSSFAHLASRKSGFPDVKTTIVHLSSFSFCRRHRRRNHRIVCLIGCEICLNIVAFVAD